MDEDIQNMSEEIKDNKKEIHSMNEENTGEEKNLKDISNESEKKDEEINNSNEEIKVEEKETSEAEEEIKIEEKEIPKEEEAKDEEKEIPKEEETKVEEKEIPKEEEIKIEEKEIPKEEEAKDEEKEIPKGEETKVKEKEIPKEEEGKIVIEEKSDSTKEDEIDEEESGDFKWYAVRIISGHGNKVKTYLDSQIKTEGLEKQIKNVLIPLEKVFEIKSGKKKVKMKNFLPGYILIEAILDDKIRSFISQTPSIINMVGAKSVKGERLDPVPLRSDEIKRINAILNEDTQSEKIDFQLSIGDPVKVTSGPFNNFTGNVLEINTEKLKVKVMVSIFGRKTPIELEFTQIERQK
jgi:transcriptional antiterminator NusG